MADKPNDIAGVQQLSLCACCVHMDQIVVREEFLQFVPITDMTGKGLADLILKSLNYINVATEYLRAQTYKGAAAISGIYKGVPAHS